MKFKKLVIFLLFLVVILASVLRLVALDKYPAGFNGDEAAIGYNAYSLLQTGKDEYGNSWPLAFKSFGDYKPGGYFYIVLPFVATLGLNEWAVRLPSALLGIGTIVLIFFLGKAIFKSQMVGLLASLLLAISPWHIHFSRGGWETNAATFFITLGILLFIKGLEKQIWIFWSLVSFLGSMYIYQSPRLVVPVLLLALFFIYRDKIITQIKVKKIALSLLVLFILTTPLILQFTSGEGGARFSGLSIFSDLGPALRVNELRGEHDNPNSILAKLEHNKLTAYGISFLGHYLDHFKPDFLFINGDPLIRNKVPETGQFYLIEALFLIVGLAALARSKFPYTKLLIAWVLVAPLASSITYQTPHALRALNMVIPLTLIMAFGMSKIFNVRGRWIITGLVFLFISFELVHYLESYYVHSPKRYPLAWEYGFSEMVQKLEGYESKYEKVVITDRYDQPYILVLFYKKYDPSKYQPQAHLSERDKFNFGTVRNFDKYEFRVINPQEVDQTKNTLYIGTDQEIPKNANILDMVKFPNGEPAFIFTEGK
jgi:4-amino-4-deoxy-L-arabinose transferase-like glycosyltransferase